MKISRYQRPAGPRLLSSLWSADVWMSELRSELGCAEGFSALGTARRSCDGRSGVCSHGSRKCVPSPSFLSHFYALKAYLLRYLLSVICKYYKVHNEGVNRKALLPFFLLYRPTTLSCSWRGNHCLSQRFLLHIKIWDWWMHLLVWDFLTPAWKGCSCAAEPFSEQSL